MPTHGSAALDAIQRKPVAAGLRRVESAEAKADRKFLAVDWREQQARVFKRVLELGSMTSQEVAHAMGYTDASQVSRWMTGVERPQWDRVASVDALRPWIAAAWGEFTGADVQTTVIVRARVL